MHDRVLGGHLIMRVVAKFQLTTPAQGHGTSADVAAALQKWSARKFFRNEQGDLVIRQSGANAVLETRSATVDADKVEHWTMLEPVDGGSLQTDVHIFSGNGRTAFRCVIGLGSDGGLVPARVPLRAPRFVRDIIALPHPWTVGQGGERVFAQSFPVDADDIDDLEALLSSPERRLPIILVSELSGETLAGDLHERISGDLSGLAHTVRLSGQAAWELTNRLGKEWSCYNGAVRLFWPFRSNTFDSRNHPLWTLDQIMSRAPDEIAGRDYIRGVISGRVIEASTYVADDTAFHDFEVKRVRRAADSVRIAAADDGDMQALADSYAAENDALRARVDEQEKEIRNLRDNVEALQVALYSSGSAAEAEAIETPPQTVAEAVAVARRELANRVAIAVETDADIEGLNPTAGPPDKILRYLRTLGALADALEAGPLGKSIPIWLREQGVECSGDSETMRGSKDGKKFRQRAVNGDIVECEYHAKPVDNVHPDMCVRIYFAVATEKPYVKIGYIGRHI